jgi:hypothetical protein
LTGTTVLCQSINKGEPVVFLSANEQQLYEQVPALLKQEKFEEALKNLESIITMNPDNHGAYLLKGIALQTFIVRWAKPKTRKMISNKQDSLAATAK